MPAVAKPNRSVLIGFNDLPDIALVRIDVVSALFACAPRTVRRRVAAGDIPAPRRQKGAAPTWSAGDLRRALK